MRGDSSLVRPRDQPGSVEGLCSDYPELDELSNCFSQHLEKCTIGIEVSG